MKLSQSQIGKRESIQFPVIGEGKGMFSWVINGKMYTSNVTILPWVVVGEPAVITTGYVVTKNVESEKIVGGIPSKELSQ